MPESDRLSTAAPSVPPPGRTAGWGLGDAALGWIVAIFCGQISATLVLALSGRDADDFDDLPLGLFALAQLGLWAGFLGVPWVVSNLKGRGMVADFGLRADVWDPLVGFVVGLGSQLFLLPLLYLPILELTSVTTDDLEGPARELTDRAVNPFDVTMLVLIVGIGAPLFEEIFYRGLVLRALEARLGVWPAVVGSGALFGLAHFNAPLSIPGLMVFGIVLGLLTVRTGRLGPAIAAHVVFNLVTVVILLLE